MANPIEVLSHADLNAVLSGTIVNEEVLQSIIDVSLEDLENSSRMGSGSVSNKGYSWPMDRLQASLSSAGAPIQNAHVDGIDVDQNDSALGQRVYNQQQISLKEVKVSLLGEAANSIGSMGKISRQVNRRGQEQMRQKETLSMANIGAQLDNGDDTPGITAGFEAWVDGKILIPSTIDPTTGFVAITYDQTLARTLLGTGTSVAGGGWADATTPSTGPDAWVYNTWTPAAMTEAALKGVMTALYQNTNSRKNRTLMLRPVLNDVVTDFYFTSSARIATLIASQGDGGPREASGALNAILTNYGKLDIVPNNLMAYGDATSLSSSALFIDYEYQEFANMTGFRIQPLAKTGLSEKRLLTQTWGLRMLSSEAQGIIQGIDETLAMTA